jgi:hypothetical protein
MAHHPSPSGFVQGHSHEMSGLPEMPLGRPNPRYRGFRLYKISPDTPSLEVDEPMGCVAPESSCNENPGSTR